MRKPTLVAAASLSIVTLLVLAYTVRALGAAPVAEAPTEPVTTRAVLGFYDAFNVALESGNVRALQGVVDSDFVDHSPPAGSGSDADGLIARVFSVRAAFPGLRLIPADIQSSGNLSVVHVETSGTTTGAFLDLPLPAASAWNQLDVFRLRNGKVVEHWGSGSADYSSTVATTVEFELAEKGRWTLSLALLEFEPGSSETTAETVAPTLFLVRSGELLVTSTSADRNGPLPSVTQDGEPGHHPLLPGDSTDLVQNDVLVVPAGAAGRLFNPGRDAATIVQLTMVQPAVGGPAMSNGETPSPVLGEPIVTRRVIASGPAITIEAGRHRFDLGWISIPPGLGIPAHVATGINVFALERGAIALSASDGDLYVLPLATGVYSKQNAANMIAGDGAMVEIGADAAMFNTGPDAAELIVVNLALAGDATT